MTPDQRTPPRRTAACDVRSSTWSLEGVHGQYSDCNSRADLYRALSQWIDTETYLNIGYSRLGQRHLDTRTHLRLIDHIADGLLALHRTGPYAGDDRLLDVGSGRGGPALRAHARWGLRVVGIDITPYNAHRAETKAKETGSWPHVRFCLGDAQRLPVRDASFSLAWSIESPAHYPDKRLFLRELGRVVKPGGAVAFADLLVVDEVAMASAETRQVYEAFLQAWDVPYLESLGSYKQAIAEAGFALRRTEIITHYNLDIWRRYCKGFLWLCRFPWLFRSYRRYLKERTGADLDNIHEHVLRSYEALRRDMIDYGLFWMVRQ